MFKYHRLITIYMMHDLTSNSPGTHARSNGKALRVEKNEHARIQLIWFIVSDPKFKSGLIHIDFKYCTNTFFSLSM